MNNLGNFIKTANNLAKELNDQIDDALGQRLAGLLKGQPYGVGVATLTSYLGQLIGTTCPDRDHVQLELTSISILLSKTAIAVAEMESPHGIQ